MFPWELYPSCRDDLRFRRQAPLDRLAAAAPARTLIDILTDVAARHPEASAIDDGSGALSYRELLARVWRTAAALHEAGVRRGIAWACACPRARRSCTCRSSPSWPRGRRTCRSTPTTPMSARAWSSVRRGCGASSRATASSSRRIRMPLSCASTTVTRRTPARTHCRWWPRRPSTTMPGSSSPRVRRAFPRASRCRTDRRRPSSRPRGACSCSASRSVRATASSRGCRWPSTPRAKRCGWRGDTARASCPRPARWCARERTWLRGCCARASPSSRRCRRWPRCGPRTRSRTCAC